MGLFGEGTFGDGQFGAVAVAVAGMTTFAIVDTDLSTVLLDLNTGTTGFTLAHDPDLGQIDLDADVLAAGPASILSRGDRGLVRVRFRLVARHSTTDDLVELARTLGTYLDRRSIFMVQLNNESEPRYFDAMRATIPNLLRGQEFAAYKIATLLMDPDGIPVEVLRRPYFYGARVTSSPATVKNDPASGTNPKRLTIDVAGNMPTRATVTIEPESGAALVQASIARRGYGDLADFRTSWFKQAESGTLTSAASIADTDASGGNAVNLISSSDTTMLKRIRWLIAPSDTTAIEGTFEVRAYLKSGISNEVRVQLKWAPGNTAAITSEPEIPLTYGAGVTQEYTMVPLGTVAVPAGQGTTYGLSLELWAARDSGSGVLRCDHIELWPVGATPGGGRDQALILSARGWRDGTGSQGQIWSDPNRFIDGSALTSPAGLTNGVAPNDSGGLPGKYVLTDADDAAGAPPAAGTVFPAGRVRFRGVANLRGGSGIVATYTVGRLYARDITGAADVAQANFTIRTGQRAHREVSMSFDANGTSAYQPQVRQVDSTGAIHFQQFEAEVQETIDDTREMVTSGEYGYVGGPPAAYVTASGVHHGPLSQEGAFLDLYPGDNELLFDWGKIPTTPGLEDADPRGPLARYEVDRNATVTISYYPRWSQ